MERVVRDFRYAIGSLSKGRKFTFVAVLALALGIGASAGRPNAASSLPNVAMAHTLSLCCDAGVIVVVVSRPPVTGPRRSGENPNPN